MRYLCLYRDLVLMDLKAQMQYRLSFVFGIVLVFLTYAVEFVALMFALAKFGGIAGWSAEQVAFLYGIVTFCYGMARVLFGGFGRFPALVRRGQVDRLLTLPLDERFQLMAAEVPLRRLGQVVLGVGVILYAALRLQIPATPFNVLFLIVTLISGTVLYGALFIAVAAVAFLTVDSNELMGILTHGTLRMASYPLTIYKPILRDFAIFAVPVAFVNFFPGLHFFGMQLPGIPVAVRYLGPVVSGSVLWLSLGLWNLGLRRYQSTGS